MTVELLAASVWVGGLVVIAVVARVAREQLAGPTRVAFFRTLGRRYLRVGAAALVVAYLDGAVLLAGGHWSGTKLALVVCASLLVVVTAGGVAQARSLTRLRAAVLAGDPRLGERFVSRRAWRAAVLRGLLAGLTFHNRRVGGGCAWLRCHVGGGAETTSFSWSCTDPAFPIPAAGFRDVERARPI